MVTRREGFLTRGGQFLKRPHQPEQTAQHAAQALVEAVARSTGLPSGAGMRNKTLSNVNITVPRVHYDAELDDT